MRSFSRENHLDRARGCARILIRSRRNSGSLQVLGVGPEIPVITRDRVPHAKPDPDLFLAAAARLGVDIGDSIVVGDSVWDLLAARRARALGVGLLSGGYGQDELEQAGAYRVYQDPADLLKHLDEVGVRTTGGEEA
jgi:phosphoglycolate phosphatase-like HAD superfamily hydrolase